VPRSSSSEAKEVRGKRSRRESRVFIGKSVHFLAIGSQQ